LSVSYAGPADREKLLALKRMLCRSCLHKRRMWS
jgi:hypothetical protein